LLSESADEDPLAALIGLGRAYRGYALAEPDLYAVMFGQAPALFDPGPEDVRLTTGTFEILVAVVSRCVEAGFSAAIRGEAPGGCGLGPTVPCRSNSPRGPPSGELGGSDAGEAFGGPMRTILAGLGADEASAASAAAG
jgi:hypothetical protein